MGSVVGEKLRRPLDNSCRAGENLWLFIPSPETGVDRLCVGMWMKMAENLLAGQLYTVSPAVEDVLHGVCDGGFTRIKEVVSVRMAQA